MRKHVIRNGPRGHCDAEKRKRKREKRGVTKHEASNRFRKSEVGKKWIKQAGRYSGFGNGTEWPQQAKLTE